MPQNKNCFDRFEMLKTDFEVGRSGIPGMARDKENNNLRVFYKCADMYSIQFAEQVRNLENEAKALVKLSGYHVPNIVDLCEYAVSSSAATKVIPYIFLDLMEPFDRLEQIYKNEQLPLLERIEIVIQMFEALDKAHSLKVVNGDVDFKHLYWIRGKSKLIIIDWGNSQHDNLLSSDDYAFDVAKTSEILQILIPSTASEYKYIYPEIFNLLNNWSREQGRPENDQGIFNTSNLLFHSKKFYFGESREFRESLDNWIPEWILNPAGDSWHFAHEKSRTLAPHYPLAQIAQEFKKSIAKVSESLFFEVEYRKHCELGEWQQCVDLVKKIIQKQYIFERPGNWLLNIFDFLLKNNLSSSKIIYKEFLSCVIWELINEKQLESNFHRTTRNSHDRLGSSILETLAWKIYPDLGKEIDLEWEQSSLYLPLKKIETAIYDEIAIFDEISVDHSGYGQYSDSVKQLNNVLEDIKKYASIHFRDNQKFSSLNELVEYYQGYLDVLNQAQEHFGAADIEKGLGISWLIKRLQDIKSTLRSIIHSSDSSRRTESGNWSYSNNLKILWLKDRENWFLFELWYTTLKKLRPDFYGNDWKMPWRYSSELYYLLRFEKFPNSNKNIREKLDLIRFGENVDGIDTEVNSESDDSYDLRDLLYFLWKRLPFGWQLDVKIVEFLCFLMAWSDIRRFPSEIVSIHNWIEKYTEFHATQKLELSNIILSNLRVTKKINSKQKKDNVSSEEFSEKVTILNNHLTASMPSNISTKQIVESKTGISGKPTEKENKISNPDSSQNFNDPRPKIISKGFWGRLKNFVSLLNLIISIIAALGLLAFALYRSQYRFPSANLSYSATPVKTVSPEISGNAASTTSALTFTPSVDSVQPTPAEIVAVYSTLLQFDTRDARLNPLDIKNENRPISVVLYPSIDSSIVGENIPVLPSLKAGGLFYNSDILYWNFRSYDDSTISTYPALNEMQLSFGSQMMIDRISRIKALSAIAEQWQFDNNTGWGFYVRSGEYEIEVIISSKDGGYKMLLCVNNAVIQEEVIDFDLSAPNTVVRIYLQLQEQMAQVYFIADNRESFNKADQTQIRYFGSLPFSGNITDVGLLSRGHVNILIDKLTVYGQ